MGVQLAKRNLKGHIMTYADKPIKKIGNTIVFLTTSLGFQLDNKAYRPKTKISDSYMSKFETKDVIDVTIDVFLQKVNIFMKENNEEIDRLTLHQVAKDFKEVAYKELTDKLFSRRFEERSIEKSFDRVMIAHFEHLFRSELNPVREIYLSRRIRHGFSVALDRMLGTDAIEQNRKAVKTIAKKYFLEENDDFDVDWQGLYEDPEVQEICDQALIDILYHFEAFEHRKKWFIGVFEINDGKKVHMNNEEEWSFGDPEFYLLMFHLYKPLKKRLLSNEKALIEKYGAKKVTELATFISKVATGMKKYNIPAN